MTILLVALILGGVGGLATGGRLSNLGRIGISWWPLLPAALVVQACLGHLPRDARWVLALADCAAIVAWSTKNRRTSGRSVGMGFGLVAVGVACNALAIAANGGMPVSAGALADAGLLHIDVARGHFYKHVLMTAHTHLRWFGDIIPLRLARTVASPGDVLMLIGITSVVWAATKISQAPRARLAQVAGHAIDVVEMGGERLL